MDAVDAAQCPIQTARDALEQSAAAIAETLIADTLAVLAGFETFAELSAYCRSLGVFVNYYDYAPSMAGLLVVEDRVYDAACKRAEELALAGMPDALRAIVTEMGFDPKMKRWPNPIKRLSVAEYLDARSPARNPKLGDKLMKRLIALPFGVDHTDLAYAVARFLSKGRNATPRGDPLVEAFGKAVKKRSHEAEDEPPAKRSHNDHA